jgi:hypothetical protein
MRGFSLVQPVVENYNSCRKMRQHKAREIKEVFDEACTVGLTYLGHLDVRVF